MSINYTYSPDPEKLCVLIEKILAADDPMQPVLIRRFKNRTEKKGFPGRDKFLKEWQDLDKVEMDYFFRPGNSDIRQFAYIKLRIEKKSAVTHCHGDIAEFSGRFGQWVTALGLIKSPQQLLDEAIGLARTILNRDLFDHIKGVLYVGNYSACLSAAVVFVEDRLRQKISPAGNGLSGVELVTVAYKSPGLLTPPLGFATNAGQNAFLMLMGWMGYVRNLHGHQATISWTESEAFQQLLGVNYVLWVTNNSTPVPKAS